MNRSDLCAKGLKKYEEFLKHDRTYHKFGRMHMMLFMVLKHREFLEHLRDCELCTPMEDRDD